MPKGIVIHDTSASNPYLRRYIGPDDGIIGKNAYDNHWNRASANKAVHAFIGKDASGEVRTYNVLPWKYECWGCGSGKNGSYNRTHIQFEICDDGYSDKDYFRRCWQEAVELCAYLCVTYDLPVSAIVAHYEAHAAGYASDHSDTRVWFKKFGESMDTFRAAVSKQLKVYRPYDDDMPRLGARVVNTPGDTLNVRQEADYKALKLGELEDKTVVDIVGLASNGWMLINRGALRGWCNGSYLDAIAPSMVEDTAKVNTPGDTLNVRILPDYKSDKVGELKHGTTVKVYCTDDATGWALVISGDIIGWVNASYLRKGR